MCYIAINPFSEDSAVRRFIKLRPPRYTFLSAGNYPNFRISPDTFHLCAIPPPAVTLSRGIFCLPIRSSP